MGRPRTCEEGSFPERERWAFGYSVDGDLRFISHRDTLRMFGRALARASLPVRYSEGFNPHPRLSIPFPRPVGVASQAESVVVEFKRPIDGEEALRELDRQTPVDIEMVSVRRLDPGERLRPAMVRYCLDAGNPRAADTGSRVRQILESAVVPMERVNPKHANTQTIDVRPHLADMHVDGSTVEFTLRVATGGDTVKPGEIAGLLGLDPRSINHRIRRLEVKWA